MRSQFSLFLLRPMFYYNPNFAPKYRRTPVNYKYAWVGHVTNRVWTHSSRWIGEKKWTVCASFEYHLSTLSFSPVFNDTCIICDSQINIVSTFKRRATVFPNIVEVINLRYTRRIRHGTGESVKYGIFIIIIIVSYGTIWNIELENYYHYGELKKKTHILYNIKHTSKNWIWKNVFPKIRYHSQQLYTYKRDLKFGGWR